MIRYHINLNDKKFLDVIFQNVKGRINGLNYGSKSISLAAYFVFILAFLVFSNNTFGLPTNLKVSDNGRYLEYRQSGKPFFWLCDTGWGIFELISREDANIYIKDRKEKGFTGFLGSLAFNSLFDNIDRPNYYGDIVWFDHDPLNPNEKYFQNVDSIIKQAKKSDLYVGLLPSWGRKVTGDKEINKDNAYEYGNFLGKRYRNENTHIIWVFGGDHPKKGQTIELEVYRLLTEGITDGVNNISQKDGKADYTSTMITFHVESMQTSAMYYHDEEWLDFNFMQTGHAERNNSQAYVLLETAYRKEPAKPIMEGEAPYEDHGIGWDLLKNGYFTDQDVRKSAYWSVFAGGCGHVYGGHTVWQFTSSKVKNVLFDSSTRGWWNEEKDGLPKAKDLPGAFDMQHLKNLVLSRPYFQRIPCINILGFRTSNEKHCEATKSADGSYAFIYFPSSGISGTINASLLSGNKINAWWYNVRDGKTYDSDLNLSDKPFLTFDKCDMIFDPPGNSYSEDWVLVLDDAEKDFSIPGIVK